MVILIAVFFFIESCLVQVSDGVAAASLPFIPHTDDSSWSVYTNTDDGFRAVTLPFKLSFGTSKQQNAYIGSNGFISFERGYTTTRYSQVFPHSSRMIVSPYWTDIYPISPNGIYYKIFQSSPNSGVLQSINTLLDDQQPLHQTMIAALVVKWVNVCPFQNKTCIQGNTFQVVLASDSSGEESYAVFTYKCGELNWSDNFVTIGYSADDKFFSNHYLSKKSNVNTIACINQPQSLWSNVIYRMSISVLPFVELPAVSSYSFTNTDDQSVLINIQPNQIFFGDTIFSSLYASSNGLMSFGQSYTTPSPIVFPISSKVIAPYWDDIELLLDGSMEYHVASNYDSQIKIQVDDFLKQNMSVDFNASVIVVVKWLKVCYYDNQCSQRNSFQLILASDQKYGTYSIFSYKCGLLNWIKHEAGIGFSDSSTFYANHPLSHTTSVNNISCLNSPANSWSNAVYRVNKVELAIQDITDELTVVKGTLVTLNCTVYGIPIPYIQWEGEDSFISDGFVTENSQQPSAIIINTLTIMGTANATFNCTAWNTHGDRVTEQTRIIVQIPPVVSSTFTEIDVPIGGPVTISCSIYGYPIPNILWIRNSNDSLHATNGQTTIDVSYNDNTAISYFTISETSYRDSGDYVCYAENDLVIRTVTERVIASILIYKNVSIYFSQDVFTATQGDSVELKCTITGVPKPTTVSWIHKDNRLPDNDNIVTENINITTTTSALIIHSVTLSDGGQYICSTFNKFGNNSSSTTLLVQAPPIIISPYLVVNVSIGKKITLSCSAHGHPLPTLDWSINGSIFNEDTARIQLSTVTIEGNYTVTSSLSIDHSMYFDSGEYICHAVNNLSRTISRIANVQVYSTPQIISYNGDYGNIAQGSTITLSCLITALPRPYSVAWYHNGMVRNSFVSTQHLNMTTTLTMYNISSAGLSDAGEYICSALNSFGGDNHTLTVQVSSESVGLSSISDTVTISIAAVISCLCIISFIVISIISAVCIRRKYKQRLNDMYEEPMAASNSTGSRANYVHPMPQDDSIPTVNNIVYGIRMHTKENTSADDFMTATGGDSSDDVYEEMRPDCTEQQYDNVVDNNDYQYSYARLPFTTPPKEISEPVYNNTGTHLQTRNDFYENVKFSS